MVPTTVSREEARGKDQVERDDALVDAQCAAFCSGIRHLREQWSIPQARRAATQIVELLLDADSVRVDWAVELLKRTSVLRENQLFDGVLAPCDRFGLALSPDIPRAPQVSTLKMLRDFCPAERALLVQNMYAFSASARGGKSFALGRFTVEDPGQLIYKALCQAHMVCSKTMNARPSRDDGALPLFMDRVQLGHGVFQHGKVEQARWAGKDFIVVTPETAPGTKSPKGHNNLSCNLELCFAFYELEKRLLRFVSPLLHAPGELPLQQEVIEKIEKAKAYKTHDLVEYTITKGKNLFENRITFLAPAATYQMLQTVKGWRSLLSDDRDLEALVWARASDSTLSWCENDTQRSEAKQTTGQNVIPLQQELLQEAEAFAVATCRMNGIDVIKRRNVSNHDEFVATGASIPLSGRSMVLDFRTLLTNEAQVPTSVFEKAVILAAGRYRWKEKWLCASDVREVRMSADGEAINVPKALSYGSFLRHEWPNAEKIVADERSFRSTVSSEVVVCDDESDNDDSDDDMPCSSRPFQDIDKTVEVQTVLPDRPMLLPHSCEQGEREASVSCA